jgi:hypothetical protein
MSTFFNDKIYAQDVMEALIPMIAPLMFFTKDVSSYSANKGDAIIVPLTSAATATTFSYNNNSGFPYENTDGTISAITVTMNEQHIHGVDISDLQAANSSTARMQNFVKQSAAAVANRLLSRVFASLLTTNFPNVVTTLATASWTKTQVRRAKLLFEQNNVPKPDRALIVDPEIEDALLGDTNIQQAYLYGGPEAIREGRIPSLMGFQVIASNLIPTNAISLVGFACHADAIVFASRYLAPQDPAAYAAVEQVTHESGFTMGYRRHFNPGKGKHFANFEVLFGTGIGITAAIGLCLKP